MGVGVFVLGMHRSGTSAATRLVNLLGLRAPAEEDLLPPDVGNPTGYWESSSLVAFNDKLLEASGSDMSCPIAFSPGWERDPRLDAFYPEAAKLFAREGIPYLFALWERYLRQALLHIEGRPRRDFLEHAAVTEPPAGAVPRAR